MMLCLVACLSDWLCFARFGVCFAQTIYCCCCIPGTLEGEKAVGLMRLDWNGMVDGNGMVIIGMDWLMGMELI